MDNTNKLEAPRENWTELWRAPFHFRATYINGEYQPGTPLEELARPFQHSRIAHLKLDPTDASLVILWSFSTEGQQYTPVHRYSSDGGPTHAQLAKIRSGQIPFSSPQFFPGNLPPTLRHEAINAITGAVSVRHSLTQEFKWAVDAGRCNIYARAGGRTAPFEHIPADIFRAYKITSWGSGLVGQSEATLDGEPTLYALYAVSTEDNQPSKFTGNVNAESLAYWDIVPAIAWVAHRTIDAVSNTISGMQQGKKSISVAAQYISGNAMLDAEAEFMQALAKGELTAWGIKNGLGDRQEIPQITWSDAVITFERHGAQVGPKDPLNLSASRWHGVQVDAQEMQSLWQKKNKSKGKAKDALPIKRGYNPTKVKKWYLEYIAEHQKAGTIPTRDEDLAAARRKFDTSVQIKFMRDLRNELAPTEWKQRGRRPAR